MKILLSLFFLITISSPVFSAPFNYKYCNLGWQHVYHEHNEASYQRAWCKLHNGIEEYKNSDHTRVDCLTDTHAVEFDFANKWKEGIGQALHYGTITGKRPKVVLILDNPKKQIIYFKRIKAISKRYDFDVEYITNDILKTDKDGKCFNSECKCQKH